MFVDDNPFERNLVRQELPMVAVPEVSDDPTLLSRATLADAGYFEASAITDEDRERTRAVPGQPRARGAEGLGHRPAVLSARAGDAAALAAASTAIGLQRIVQLINKTNQFNLTTRRYTEDDVLAVMADPRAFGLQLRLLDRFGDNGIIAIVIGRLLDDADLLIDTWLMSCRVLGRQVEPTTLNLIAEQARRLGATTAGRRVHPDQEERHGEGSLRQAGFHASMRSDATAGGNRTCSTCATFTPAETFIDVTEG